MRNSFGILAVSLMLGLAGGASAQVADLVPSPGLAYEGRLTESNVLVTGARPFIFSILDANGNELLELCAADPRQAAYPFHFCPGPDRRSGI